MSASPSNCSSPPKTPPTGQVRPIGVEIGAVHALPLGLLREDESRLFRRIIADRAAPAIVLDRILEAVTALECVNAATQLRDQIPHVADRVFLDDIGPDDAVSVPPVSGTAG